MSLVAAAADDGIAFNEGDLLLTSGFGKVMEKLALGIDVRFGKRPSSSGRTISAQP